MRVRATIVIGSLRVRAIAAIWIGAALILPAVALAQPKYTGAKPPRQDLPYLVQGDTLVPLEVSSASQQDRKDDTLYTVPGDSSAAKTPLSSPVFVLDSARIDATKLQLFRMDVKGGHRELVFRRKGKANLQPITLSVSVVSGTLYRLEVVPSLENGEYSLSPEGSNQVFSFTVY